MNQLFFNTRASRYNYLSNIREMDAQTLKHIPTQQSEYEFLKRSIEDYDIYVIALNRYENDGYYRHLSSIQLDTIFDKISERIAMFRRENPDKYIFVLFSESFFGTDPLIDVQFVVDKYKSLSTQYRVIVQASFLHRFDVREASPWLRDYKPIVKSKQIAERITRDAKESKRFLIANRWHPDRIANYTITFYSEEILAIYRKSTHCQAAWTLIIPEKGQQPQCAYEFGDFQSHKLSESPIAKLFCGENPLIATRMCSDMNDPHLSSETKLAIVHANGHPNQQYHYEDLTIPILFIDDQGISIRKLIKNFSESSEKVHNKPANITWKINGEYISTQSCFRCFPFELSKILNIPDNDKPQILDYISYELN